MLWGHVEINELIKRKTHEDRNKILGIGIRKRIYHNEKQYGVESTILLLKQVKKFQRNSWLPNKKSL